MKEILSIYEDRWNIETGHRESNQQLGFKEYQMHSKKKAIARFIQVVFSVWTVLLLLEMEDPDGNAKEKTISEMTDKIKTSGILAPIIDVLDYLNLPPPEKEL